jgi:hypothetical protein
METGQTLASRANQLPQWLGKAASYTQTGSKEKNKGVAQNDGIQVFQAQRSAK